MSGRCRACGGPAAAVLRLPAMPRAVQRLPRPNELRTDRPIALRVVRCRTCGLVQLAGAPPRHRYAGDYLFSVNFSPAARAYQRALAEHWIRRHGLRRRAVLEIGGGDGWFAGLLAARGCAVTLVEPAPGACRRARRRGLARVVQGAFPGRGLPAAARFDAAVLRHVLEHAARPVALLAAVRRRLRPDGRLLIEVPNLDGIIAGGRLQDVYAEHLSYFTPAALARAIEQAGFRLLELGTLEGGDYLECAAMPARRGIERLASDLAGLRRRVRALIRGARNAGRTVAVYGAGGRGVSLLALIGARDLGLAYAVDADAKKWGRRTPVTRLPVVSPAVLRRRPTDDLLITATAFQDEIVRELAWFRADGRRRLGVLTPAPRWLPRRPARRVQPGGCV